MNIKSHIPNTITCLNLLSGAVASVLALMGNQPLGSLTAIEWSFIAIGCATVFDFCDGAAARLLRAYSDVGKELDSLSDLVSFGLAPALMLFSTICEAKGGFSFWALMPALILVCGALRLAKFNVDTRQTTSFIGLPIPANAIFWIGTVAWIRLHGCPAMGLLLAITICESLLMVSSLRMFSLKFANFDWRENFRRYVLILAAVLFVITDGLAGFTWTILFYILVSAVGRKEKA